MLKVKILKEMFLFIVEYPDRLARFGYTYLKEFAKSYNVEIEVIEQNQKVQPNEEMVKDLVSIVTCFSARCGRKAKKDIEKVIQELEQERSANSENNN